MTEADRIEAERIKDQIRATTTREQLQAVVDAERAALLALEARPGCAVFRPQVQNLVSYMLRVEFPYQARRAAQQKAPG